MSEQNRSTAEFETRHRKLRDIFIATTGSEGFTETQHQRPNSRRVADEESVAEVVTALAKDDGLRDTYADLVYRIDGV
ncbi:hypothetical protein [Natronomonas amylolytica]|uniref:hypothetical protein n=1 Tax=Natronomonas amylolytica TaxID=3108498 RepID=UPI00300AED6E